MTIIYYLTEDGSNDSNYSLKYTCNSIPFEEYDIIYVIQQDEIEFGEVHEKESFSAAVTLGLRLLTQCAVPRELAVR